MAWVAEIQIQCINLTSSLFFYFHFFIFFIFFFCCYCGMLAVLWLCCLQKVSLSFWYWNLGSLYPLSHIFFLWEIWATVNAVSWQKDCFLCLEFRAFIITNVNHLRASVSQIARSMASLQLGGSASAQQRPAESLGADDEEVLLTGAGALFGMPAMEPEIFEAFESRLEDPVYVKSVVTHISKILSSIV